jgi:kinesin family protein 18/19
LTEEEIIQGATIISHKIANDNHIVLIDPLDDPDDILRANRSRERQFVFDMVFDAQSTQVILLEKTVTIKNIFKILKN